ncbi:DNA-binding domain-containing protein [Psychromonas hadalis]|uniref:HvfC/BufC N-terminal domain-containing protein n=1 Tax=Psychromonas hadalis TaxID=211669 RepID=UPI0003B5F18F|nr:DNA-binding domain-containing protein [Psychromonas hadalis]
MKLRQLQKQFSESLLYQHENILEQIKERKSINSEQRLQVYRNSFIMGVTEALATTYQHTVALVGEDFFNAVSRQFILNQPPIENNIIVYGDGFSDYLDRLPQLKKMPYISEMARFEWLLEQTSNIEVENKSLDVARLAEVDDEQLEQLQFSIPKQITLFQSEQNINQLYKMIINNAVIESNLNIPCYLALKKQPDFRIELITLNKDQFLLLDQIKAGKCLGQITPITLHQQLPHLLEKRLINDFSTPSRS